MEREYFSGSLERATSSTKLKCMRACDAQVAEQKSLLCDIEERQMVSTYIDQASLKITHMVTTIQCQRIPSHGLYSCTF